MRHARSLVVLLMNVLGIACVILTLSFTHTTIGRGKSARTELKIGWIDPWLVRTSNGGRVVMLAQPNPASVLTAAGALLLLVGARFARPKPFVPDELPPVPDPPPENTPVDG